MRRWWVAVLPALVLAAAPAGAEEPLWGETASTIGKGFVNVTTRGGVFQSEPFQHHGGIVVLTTERTEAAAMVEYGLRPDLDLHLRVPYFEQKYEESFAGQTITNHVSGMGEMQVGAKWRFQQWFSEQRKDELALLGGLKLPTGEDDLRDSSGALILPSLQPNSGNLGVMLGLAANRHTALGGYWLSTMVNVEDGSDRYRRGTMLEAHASAGFRPRRLTRPDQTDWMGIVGLHYHRMGNDQEGGRTVPDSGGSSLGAELSLLASKRTWGARLGVLFGLHNNGGHAPLRREIQASIRGNF